MYGINHELYARAHAAGQAAVEEITPTPMVVTDGHRQWHIADGMCGFAWITVRPGNSPFANWLKKNGHARPAYGGGVQIWVSDYNQSIERKYAYAQAFAEVLVKAGVKAYAGSRLD